MFVTKQQTVRFIKIHKFYLFISLLLLLLRTLWYLFFLSLNKYFSFAFFSLLFGLFLRYVPYRRRRCLIFCLFICLMLSGYFFRVKRSKNAENMNKWHDNYVRTLLCENLIISRVKSSTLIVNYLFFACMHFRCFKIAVLFMRVRNKHIKKVEDAMRGVT